MGEVKNDFIIVGLNYFNYYLVCTCQQKLDTKLKKLGIKIEYLYKIQ